MGEVVGLKQYDLDEVPDFDEMRTIINTQRLLLQFTQRENTELKQIILEPPKNTYGYFDDPRWSEVKVHEKNNATLKARKLTYKIRTDYGLE